MKRIAIALERIADALESLIDYSNREPGDGVLKMKDVDRAKVYSTHLGEKLRDK